MFKKVEIVIVDDGSKDKTLDLIKSYTAKHTTDKSIVVRGL
jgi:glycosyltransferase involved in cell wall biosynthesis